MPFDTKYSITTLFGQRCFLYTWTKSSLLKVTICTTHYTWHYQWLFVIGITDLVFTDDHYMIRFIFWCIFVGCLLIILLHTRHTISWEKSVVLLHAQGLALLSVMSPINWQTAAEMGELATIKLCNWQVFKRCCVRPVFYLDGSFSHFELPNCIHGSLFV